MKFKVPWPQVYEEANRAVHVALRNSINSSNLPKIVLKAAVAAFLAVIAQYLAIARGVLEQAGRERKFLDVELADKFREKQQQSVRLNQPLKIWTVLDVVLVVLLFIFSGTGMVVEWNAISQILIASDPLGHDSFFKGLLASGIMILLPASIKAAAPNVLDNYPANRRYTLGLFLLSLILALFWLLSFASLNDKAPLNSLAMQLVSPVISPADEEFERILFFVQMVSQALGSALISGFLFLKAENIIRTHRRRGHLREGIIVTGSDVSLDDIQARHRSLVGAAAQAQAVIDEIPARKDSFVVGWMARADAAMEAKAALEEIIGPFTIVPEDQ